MESRGKTRKDTAKVRTHVQAEITACYELSQNFNIYIYI